MEGERAVRRRQTTQIYVYGAVALTRYNEQPPNPRLVEGGAGSAPSAVETSDALTGGMVHDRLNVKRH